MKNILRYSIFIVILLSSIQTYAQMSEEFAIGNKVLKEFGFNTPCYSFQATSYGIYIGSRLRADGKFPIDPKGNDGEIPINFLYRDNKLNELPELKNYIVMGYNPIKNFLFVGWHNPKNRYADTMCRDFFTYDITSHQFKKQVSFNSEVYRVEFKNDTLFCKVNTKNPDGIGSETVPHKIPIK